jgi:hypothetical protein
LTVARSWAVTVRHTAGPVNQERDADQMFGRDRYRLTVRPGPEPIVLGIGAVVPKDKVFTRTQTNRSGDGVRTGRGVMDVPIEPDVVPSHRHTTGPEPDRALDLAAPLHHRPIHGRERTHSVDRQRPDRLDRSGQVAGQTLERCGGSSP